MLTLKVLNESFMAAIENKWIKSISGVYFLKYTGTIPSEIPYEKFSSNINKPKDSGLNQKDMYHCFYEIYSDYEAFRELKPRFKYKDLINHEIVESKDLIRELDEKQRRTDRWNKLDKRTFIAQNLPTVFKHKDLIYSNPRYYWAEVPNAGVYLPYLGLRISLGFLLEMWDQGQLIHPCSKCGNPSYSIGYSKHTEILVCPTCQNYHFEQSGDYYLWRDIASTCRQEKPDIRTFRFDTIVDNLTGETN
jgi:hypothetical protein